MPTSRERVFIQTDFPLGFIMEEYMFDRTLKIIEGETFNLIQKQKILLVGVGGVGTSALEALVRLGFTNITIIDNDIIDESNLNRQIITNKDNIGLKKVDVARERYLKINPNLSIKTMDIFLNEENISKLAKYDFIIDACDTLKTKVLLIKYAKKFNINIITCLGTGNRLNPSMVSITTLDKTYNDPLAKTLRNLLKKENISLKIPVVFSSELPIKTKDRSVGSISLVPTSAGLNLVYYVLKSLKLK